MDKLIPTICGKNSLHIPESECSDCEKLEKRVEDLEECCETSTEKIEKLEACCEDVGEQLDKKLEVQNILAGDNITIEQDGNNITISSTGGGGGGCTCTKEEILNCIGVREMDITLSGTDGEDEEWLILGRLKDEVIGDGSAVSSCDCTKWELLDILGYQEIDLTMRGTDGSSNTWTVIGKPKQVEPRSRAIVVIGMKEPRETRMPETNVGDIDFAWDAMNIADIDTGEIIYSFGAGIAHTDDFGTMEVEADAPFFGDEANVGITLTNIRSVNGYCPAENVGAVTNSRSETVTETETTVTYRTANDIATFIRSVRIESINYNTN